MLQTIALAQICIDVGCTTASASELTRGFLFFAVFVAGCIIAKRQEQL